MALTYFCLVSAEALFAGLVWVDRDRQAKNYWGEWVDEGTRDGVCLRLNVCSVNFFTKGYKN